MCITPLKSDAEPRRIKSLGRGGYGLIREALAPYPDDLVIGMSET